ncbi:isocitrate lyase/phosphoenolpyruvate mutase family protein [Streptomyces sp. NPDC005438]|uniref:isocitrate lyase/PEP mutase family protein n=1 Tax=Streptomyces sp. NPDC005438 TaxID=3156880 RepID=UPI0033AD638C
MAAFRAAHVPHRPLVLPNVWDASSARAFAGAGWTALATSSAAVAEVLGHRDGEHTPADRMLAAVEEIARAVRVPVTADMERGYGLEPEELVERLLATGVVGCNLEDTDPATGELVDVAEQAAWWARVRSAAGDRLVLNARVDSFLRAVPGASARGMVEDAVRRGRAYAAAGVDCVYPLGAPPESLPELVARIGAPVNGLSHPDGASPRELGRLGAARVTFGEGLYRLALARGVRGERLAALLPGPTPGMPSTP